MKRNNIVCIVTILFGKLQGSLPSVINRHEQLQETSVFIKMTCSVLIV